MRINQDFTMYVDSHDKLEATVSDVENLTGSVIKWKMAKHRSDEPIIEKHSGNNGITIDGNKFTIIIEPQDNKTLQQDQYYHEARMTDSQGNTRPIMSGAVTVVETLTRS